MRILKETKEEQSLVNGETINGIEDIKGKRKKNKAWSMERLETGLRTLKKPKEEQSLVNEETRNRITEMIKKQCFQ